MPTITKSSEGMVAPTAASLQTNIDTLFVNISTGSIISANDINLLAVTYNSFLNHFHSVNDVYGMTTFGDGRPGIDQPVLYATDPGSSQTTNTGVVIATFSTLSNVVSGTVFTASAHNTLANSINGLQGHYHTWDDRTS